MQSGKVEDVGLTSEVVWRLEKGTLVREETVTSKQPVSIRRWRLAIPSTHNNFDMEQLRQGFVRFQSSKGILDVIFGADFPVQGSLVAAGDTAIGRGVHGAIPLHLVYEARDLNVSSRSPLKYKLVLKPGSQDAQK
jgi:hypothetical protein